jgi:hypothetical protein
VGVHRSGTTLLRYILNSHPRIYIPPESDFFPRFFQKRPNATLDRQDAIKIIETIFKEYRFVQEWQGGIPDSKTFVDNLSNLKPAFLLNSLYSQYAGQFGAERWGDKTPVYTSYMDLIIILFPDAQFIHIIRDGRDVALSMLDKWGQKEHHIDILYAAESWERRLQKAFVSAAKLDTDHYYELRYEDLVTAPEEVVHKICDFLGESFVLEMIEPHLLGRERIQPNGFHAPVRQPLSPSRINRWRVEMEERDRKIFQAVAYDMLKRLDYKVEDLNPLSFSEFVRFSRLKIKYNLLQTGRTILQSLGVFHPN